MADVIVDRSDYYPEYLVARVINAVVGIVEFILLLRVVFELLGANPAAAFIAWIYDMSARLMGPFVGAFPNFSVAGFTLDTSAIFAMIGYAIIGWIIGRILSVLFGEFATMGSPAIRRGYRDYSVRDY
jgi:hypothetical protein